MNSEILMDMIKKKKLPVGKMKINNENQGVYAVGFVSEPANGVRLVALSNDENKTIINAPIKMANEMKMTVTSALLIPGQMIPRAKGFFLTADADVIELTAKKFARGMHQNKTTHQHDSALSDIVMFESWIVREGDNRAETFGYSSEEIIPGTWMCTYDLSEHPDEWEKVLSGEITGLSIEAIYDIIFDGEVTDIDTELSAEVDVLAEIESLESMLQNPELSDLDKYDSLRDFLQKHTKS